MSIPTIPGPKVPTIKGLQSTEKPFSSEAELLRSLCFHAFVLPQQKDFVIEVHGPVGCSDIYKQNDGKQSACLEVYSRR